MDLNSDFTEHPSRASTEVTTQNEKFNPQDDIIGNLLTYLGSSYARRILAINTSSRIFDELHQFTDNQEGMIYPISEKLYAQLREIAKDITAISPEFKLHFYAFQHDEQNDYPTFIKNLSNLDPYGKLTHWWNICVAEIDAFLFEEDSATGKFRLELMIDHLYPENKGHLDTYNFYKPILRLSYLLIFAQFLIREIIIKPEAVERARLEGIEDWEKAIDRAKADFFVHVISILGRKENLPLPNKVSTYVKKINESNEELDLSQEHYSIPESTTANTDSPFPQRIAGPG